jgi:hypothetical protein
MINFDDLTVEERAEVDAFSREIERALGQRHNVLPESEISKLETVLNGIVERVANSGRQQADKINA